MNQPISNCPKCSGEMDKGYPLDQSHGAMFSGQWVKGTPKRSWLDLFGALVIKNPNAESRIPIGAFRCQSCGFLELYAREEYRAT